MNKNLSALNDQLLIQTLESLVRREREICVEVLHHLREVKSRRLHLAMGYDSLFTFAVKHLLYTRGAAYRRIEAMQLLGAVPGAEKLILDGSHSLTTVALAQGFFRNEEIRGENTYTDTAKAELVHELAGKSKVECYKALAAISPDSVPLPKESTRVLTPTKTEIRFVADDDLMAKLEKLKALLAHHGGATQGYAGLIEVLADQALKRLDPARAVRPVKRVGAAPVTAHVTAHVTAPVTAPAADPISTASDSAPAPALPPGQSPLPAQPEFSGSPENSRTRHIPRAIRRLIWSRAEGRCEFVDDGTGRRCESPWALQVDHIVPFAKGGPTVTENLRLLCRSHNQYAAVLEFGADQMKGHLKLALG